jgi:hypothetical protein
MQATEREERAAEREMRKTEIESEVRLRIQTKIQNMHKMK